MFRLFRFLGAGRHSWSPAFRRCALSGQSRDSNGSACPAEAEWYNTALPRCTREEENIHETCRFCGLGC